MDELKTFQEVICKNREDNVLLLGNGFSQGFSSCFAYQTLGNEVLDKLSNEQLEPRLTRYLSNLRQNGAEINLESLLNELNFLCDMTPELYYAFIAQAESKKIECFKTDIGKFHQVLWNTFLEIFCNIHPDSLESHNRSATIIHNCITHLNKFDAIYTLSYDLLLYWLIVTAIKLGHHHFKDGLYIPGKYYKSWSKQSSKNQNIYYLHGGIHLYGDDPLIKLTRNKNNMKTLKRMIISLVQSGHFPNIVFEGNSRQKQYKIAKSPYLSHAHDKLSYAGSAKQKNLVVYGCSVISGTDFNNDNHVWKRVFDKNNFKNVYLGIYDRNKDQKIELVRKLTDRDLNVEFFRTDENPIWH